MPNQPQNTNVDLSTTRMPPNNVEAELGAVMIEPTNRRANAFTNHDGIWPVNGTLENVSKC